MTTQGTTVRQVRWSGLKVPVTRDVLWNLRQISHMTVYMAYKKIFQLKHSLLQCVYCIRMQWKLFLYVVWSKRPCWVEISTWRRCARLTYKSAKGNLPFLMQNECDSSPFDHQSIIMNDHFMGTATIFWNTDFSLIWITNAFKFKFSPQRFTIARCMDVIICQLCKTEIDHCSSNPCSHNGTCLGGRLWYACQCLDGYSGTHCQIGRV